MKDFYTNSLQHQFSFSADKGYLFHLIHQSFLFHRNFYDLLQVKGGLVQTTLSASVTSQARSARKKNQYEKDTLRHGMYSTFACYMPCNALGTVDKNEEVKLSLPSVNFSKLTLQNTDTSAPNFYPYTMRIKAQGKMSYRQNV